MSEGRSASGGFGLFTVTFVAMKACAHWYIASWSWWWVLCPIVPIGALVLRKLGL